VRAGRTRIPVGGGTALLTHGFIDDIAWGVRLVLEAGRAAVGGEVFNFGERRTPTMALRARWILDAAGATDTELVRVPDDALPPDLGLLATIDQPLLVSSDKARARLGWEESDPLDALRTTVEWHLANPPADQAEEDWSSDDAALERAHEVAADATA
jgi:nucleoside-diphosphate-sugar epimerase